MNLPSRIALGFVGSLLLLMVGSAFLTRKSNERLFMPVIGLEYGRNPAELKDYLPENGPAALKADINKDSYGFIPAYIGIFLILAFHIKNSNLTDGSWFFYTILACALIAALADWAENILILKTTYLAEPDPLFANKFTAYFLKWLMIGFAIFLVSLGYLRMGKPGVAIPGLLNALILVGGLLFDAALIQWGFGMMGLLLLLAAILS
jgi:hypothetical protein